MANATLYGSVPGLSPRSATFNIYKVLTNGTATPEAIFNAATPVPINFRVVDFFGWNNTGAAQAGALFTLRSNLNGVGLVDLSDPLAVNIMHVIARATTINNVQSLLTAGAVTPDVLAVAKNAAADAGLAIITAFLR